MKTRQTGNRKGTYQPTTKEKQCVFKINKLKRVIKNLNPHKAPGPDLITAQMIQELPIESTQTLLHLYNAILRLEYWPKTLKQARVIMILKLGKNPNDVQSYRPVSLLPVIAKILEKLLLTRLLKEAQPSTWIPTHQFGFRKGQSTTQQCHRLTDIINKHLKIGITVMRSSLA